MTLVEQTRGALYVLLTKGVLQLTPTITVSTENIFEIVEDVPVVITAPPDEPVAVQSSEGEIIVVIELPPTITEAVTINIVETTEGNLVSDPDIGFLNQVLDIEVADNGCQSGCDFTFVFTDADLATANLSLSQVSVFHDANGNGVFEESEALPTTVTPSVAPGPYTGSATASFTSKFAIGGVVPSLAVGGSSG